MTTTVRTLCFTGLLSFIPCLASADLASAVGSPAGLVFTTDGSAQWYEDLSAFYSAGTSARSGWIGDSQNTSMRVSVTGPGAVSFVWKVSSELCCDGIELLVDGVSAASNRRGEHDWTHMAVGISSGVHEVQWKYSKDGSIVSGWDAGWVDAVNFIQTGAAITTAWSYRSSLSTVRTDCAAAAIGDQIYVIGGSYLGMSQNANEQYNRWTNAVSGRTAMNYSRESLAVAVDNGKIYAIGGYDTTFGNRAENERYDPGTDWWTIMAPMPTARQAHGAAVVDGYIYCVGGDSGFVTASVEAYYITGNTWSSKTSMPTGRKSLGVAAVNRKVYAIGGRNGAGSNTNVVEIYDPSTDGWTSGAAMPTARSKFGIAVLAGRIWCIGGDGIAAVESYDPVADTWEIHTNLAANRWGHGCAVSDQRIYSLGGLISGFGVSSIDEGSVTVTAPVVTTPVLTALTWTIKQSLPTARYRLAAASANNVIYAVGGYGNSQHLRLLEIYNPSANSWTGGTAPNESRSRLAAAAANGRIYVAGGYDGTANEDSLEEYNPSMTFSPWMSMSPMTVARYGLAMAEANGKVYAIGGYDGGYLTTVEEYDPSTYMWTTRAAMPTARRYLTAVALDGKIYAIGGETSSGSSGKVEAYDPSTDAWAAKADLPGSRYGLAAGVVGGRIYAFGGYDGTSYSVQTHEYEPTTNTWTSKTNLNVGRGYLAGAVANDKLYAIGGYNSSSFTLGTVEEGSLSTSGAGSSALQNARDGKVTLRKGEILIAPNIFVRANPGTGLSFVLRGDPSGRVEMRIYNEIGAFMGSLPDVNLDRDGFGEAAYKGQQLEHYLGTGLYYVYAEGGGVSDRKPFVIKTGGR